jgi:hypothetical protein
MRTCSVMAYPAQSSVGVVRALRGVDLELEALPPEKPDSIPHSA